MSVLVFLDEDELLDQLMDRLSEYWHVFSSDTTYKLFNKYYEDCLNDGRFEECEFNVINIVDNDYVNNFNVYSSIEEAEEDFSADDWNDNRIVAELETGEVLVYKL